VFQGMINEVMLHYKITPCSSSSLPLSTRYKQVMSPRHVFAQNRLPSHAFSISCSKEREEYRVSESSVSLAFFLQEV
jgi:hypothetical protein